MHTITCVDLLKSSGCSNDEEKEKMQWQFLFKIANRTRDRMCSIEMEKVQNDCSYSALFQTNCFIVMSTQIHSFPSRPKVTGQMVIRFPTYQPRAIC